MLGAAHVDGNCLPSRQELQDDLRATGLALVDEMPLAEAPETPGDWTRVADRVDKVIERDHQDDERWQQGQAQQETIVGLIRDELVVGLPVMRRRDDPQA